MVFIDSNNLHVSGVTCPSSGARETVCAAWCRIQLSLILSLCLSRAVSVQGLVAPGMMCVGYRRTSIQVINLLKPNNIYTRICCTAALTSRRYILIIYSTNIHTEYFKHAA